MTRVTEHEGGRGVALTFVERPGEPGGGGVAQQARVRRVGGTLSEAHSIYVTRLLLKEGVGKRRKHRERGRERERRGERERQRGRDRERETVRHPEHIKKQDENDS